MRHFLATLLLAGLVPVMACSGGRSAVPQSGSVSGNWQITLNGTTPPALVLSGFLSQLGNSVSGSLVQYSNSNCSGVGSVTGTGTGQNISGTVNGQNVSLNINQSGAIIGLTGTAFSGTGASMSGDFTSQPGVCSSIPSSGSWSAVQVAPVAGGFHGSFTSIGGIVLNVTGTLSQGPNTGYSTATLSGTLATTSNAAFCSYLLAGTITGLISGTNVQLNLYGENGLEYAQLGKIGNLNPLPNPPVTVSPDGSSISGPYSFNALSDSCPSDSGNFNLSFP